MSRIEWPDGVLPVDFEWRLHPKDYAKHPKGSFWLLRAPNGQIGSITPQTHSVDEHADGTITVSPSLDYQRCPQGQTCPLCEGRDASFAMMWFPGLQAWHGWLRRGEWIEAGVKGEQG